jgi:acetoacetyl-CoA synthetase
MFPRPDFFGGARLNFAKNLLYPQVSTGFSPINEDDVAIVEANEAFSCQMTWKELRLEVRKCANALRPQLQVGDRVAGFLGNHAMTVVAMLAATSLGAIVSVYLNFITLSSHAPRL